MSGCTYIFIICGNTSNSFACLTRVDASLLETANLVINNAGFFGTFVVVPVVDGELIIEQPMKTIAKGNLNAVRFKVSLTCYHGS